LWRGRLQKYFLFAQMSIQCAKCAFTVIYLLLVARIPEIETGKHVKNKACAVKIKIKWMIRKHMTYENTYRDDTYLKLILQPKLISNVFHIRTMN
jgi:hypothetical protein